MTEALEHPANVRCRRWPDILRTYLRAGHGWRCGRRTVGRASDAALDRDAAALAHTMKGDAMGRETLGWYHARLSALVRGGAEHLRDLRNAFGRAYTGTGAVSQADLEAATAWIQAEGGRFPIDGE